MSSGPFHPMGKFRRNPAIGRPEVTEFARRLFKIMKDKGFSQSDLARKIWGEREDKNGHLVAKNRDRISCYLSGRSFPEPDNLDNLAKALGVTVEELAPTRSDSITSNVPEFSMTAIPGSPKDVYLEIARVLPLSVATQVIALIEQH